MDGPPSVRGGKYGANNLFLGDRRGILNQTEGNVATCNFASVQRHISFDKLSVFIYRCIDARNVLSLIKRNEAVNNFFI